LVAITVSVEELPEVIDVGLAVMLTVGAGLVTVTVALAEIFPPVPVAVAVYVVVAVGATDCVPPVDARV
jgi:phage shock protein PspC (stress-responsive transcriptional regulator)